VRTTTADSGIRTTAAGACGAASRSKRNTGVTGGWLTGICTGCCVSTGAGSEGLAVGSSVGRSAGAAGGGVESTGFGAGVTLVLTPAERVEVLVTFAAVETYSTFTPGGTSRESAKVLVAVTARFFARMAFAAAVPVFDALPSTVILMVPPPAAAS
jgi:hypothetical protein